MIMKVKRTIGEKGQIVIPVDVRKIFKWHKGSSVELQIQKNGVLVKTEQDPEEFLKDFLNVPKPKGNITLKELRKIEEDSYDLP